MNTNSNTYTVVYTAIVVVVVAAVLAFVATSLAPRQEANEKADTISQILTAAQLGSKDDFQAMGNANVLAKYSSEMAECFTVNVSGEKVGNLDIASQEIYSVNDLKKQNDLVKHGETDNVVLPVYVFNNSTVVVPVYGAGLWGPIWGYVALEKDLRTVKGAYFDHASETPGLGAKIKDDPAFQAEFCGEKIDLDGDKIFAIVKGGSPKDASGKSAVDNKIDAISGATMTSNGLDDAINTWLGLYKAYFSANGCNGHEGCGNHENCGDHEGCSEDECCGGHEEGKECTNPNPCEKCKNAVNE